MEKFLEHLNSHIINITSSNISKNENNFEESFQNSLNEISNFMQKLDIDKNEIREVTDSLKSKFNELVQEGVSPEEAYRESFESMSDILSLSISDKSLTKIQNNDQNSYDLSFASSSVNDKSLLIDDAMSRGMSVEEAIRYVDKQINPSLDEEFGPTNTVKSDNTDSTNKILTKSEDEINLDKIEADMDEQANKVSREKSDHTENSSTKGIFVDTHNDKLEDDDMS